MSDTGAVKPGEFERLLPQCPFAMRAALIDVCDTMDMVRLWFVGRGVPFYAADLVAATQIVLRREKAP